MNILDPFLHTVLLHVLIFTVVVAAGCGMLSVAVRTVARILRVDYLESLGTRGRFFVPVVLVKFGIVGAGGQMLFAALNAIGLPYPIARLVSWLLTGLLIGGLTAHLTPFMPIRRAGIVGAVAGLTAWAAFNYGLASEGELMARALAVLVTCLVLPLAVVFPLPAQAVHIPTTYAVCEDCTCGRSVEYIEVHTSSHPPLLDLTLRSESSITPTTTPDSVMDLLTEMDRMSLPGRVTIGGRVMLPHGRVSNIDGS